MERKMIWALALLLLLPVDMMAQNKIEKTVETASEAVEAVSGVVSLFKRGRKRDSAEQKNTQDIAQGEEAVVGESFERTTGRFKVVTHHPDFKVKVKRCEASAKTCVIDLIFENVGSNDVNISAGKLFGAIAYDDEANQYEGRQDNDVFKIAIGNLDGWMWSSTVTLMSEIPVKARIQIEGVSESAEVFRRIQIPIRSDVWGIGSREKWLTFHNLPISREGDE